MTTITKKDSTRTSGWVRSALPLGVSGVLEMIRGIISAVNGRSPGMVRARPGGAGLKGSVT